ncbi:MAG: nitrite reductase (NAD(P)H) small subunit [Gemmatimonadetes bacterium]|nr:nitrite reductase (NAD(P)H) small subunit [Gemmatimonadota bacterium]
MPSISAGVSSRCRSTLRPRAGKARQLSTPHCLISRETLQTVVTCPWHGAQFEVTTGQVVGPPAGQSVPTYTVVVEGEAIQVDVS